MNADLFTQPRGEAAQELAKLAARHAELRAEVRALRQQNAVESARRDELVRRQHDAEAAARAFGDRADARSVKTMAAELAKLDRTAAARSDEVRVVTDAATAVEGAIARHAAEHLGALLAEIEEDAAAAAQRLSTAVEEFADAFSAYQGVGVRAEEVLRIAGDLARLQAERLPNLPDEVAQFGRRAGALVQSIPVPMPRRPGATKAEDLAVHVAMAFGD